MRAETGESPQRVNVQTFKRSNVQVYERLAVILIFAAYAVLVIGFSLGPIFEGPDEIAHYRYIRALKLTTSLPDPYAKPGGEYHQAPLYYILMAPAALPLSDGDLEIINQRLNPHIGYAFHTPGNDNKNQFYHTRAEAFPYTGSETALTIHLLRLGSLLLGLGTVATCAAIFRLLWPDRLDLRLMALGFTAFTPQFAYLSGVVTNDSLLILLCSASLLVLLRQHTDGPSRRWALLLGGVLGAALLTKLSAGFLAIPVGVSVILDRRAWRYVPLVLLVTVAIAGWWYARNYILFGDPTGMRLYFELIPSDVIQPSDLTLFGMASRFAYIYQTFWARFGYNTVLMGHPVYTFYGAIALLVILTLPLCGYRFIRSTRQKTITPAAFRHTIVMVVFGLAWIISIVYSSTLARTLTQGRFLLPGLAVWAAAFALSIDVWAPKRLKLVVAPLVPMVMAVVAAVCVFGYFLPAYQTRPIPETIPYPLHYQYEDTAELIGASTALLTVYPGQTTRVTLYWRALKTPDNELHTYLGTPDESVIWRESIPGTGNFPSIDWRPGETWAEEYVVFVSRDAQPGAEYPLLAGLFDPATGRELIVIDESGASVTPVIGRVIVIG